MNLDVIGDLHGNIHGLEATQQKLQKHKEETTPLSKHADQIWLGDILCDRVPKGLECYQLALELEKRGLNVTTLFGNHDLFAIWILLGINHPKLSQTVTNNKTFQLVKGISEFIKLINPEIADQLFINRAQTDQIQKLYSQMLQIPSKEIREFLEEIYPGILQKFFQSKLAHVVGNTLFIHCDPRTNILKFVLENGIEGIEQANTDFQEFLDTMTTNNNPPDKSLQRARELSQIFLSTNPRERFLETEDRSTTLDFIHKLNERGINRIIHGHTCHNLPIMKIICPDKSGELTIIAADRGFGHPQKISNGDYSALNIRGKETTYHFRLNSATMQY